jgi:hypothetical protein
LQTDSASALTGRMGEASKISCAIDLGTMIRYVKLVMLV